MSVRAKFICNSVRKYRSDNWDPKTQKSEMRFMFEYEFGVVTGGSDEDKQFWASTPTGSLKMSAVRDDLFEPGKSYYLDFALAE